MLRLKRLYTPTMLRATLSSWSPTWSLCLLSKLRNTLLNRKSQHRKWPILPKRTKMLRLRLKQCLRMKTRLIMTTAKTWCDLPCTNKERRRREIFLSRWSLESQSRNLRKRSWCLHLLRASTSRTHSARKQRDLLLLRSVTECPRWSMSGSPLSSTEKAVTCKIRRETSSPKYQC